MNPRAGHLAPCGGRRGATQALPLALALALATACADPGRGVAPGVARDGRPNLLLIVADDLGFGDLGSYGGDPRATPRLDALAAAGVRCTDFSVASPVCSPSRASLLSGRSPGRHGLTEVLLDDETLVRLDPAVPLLPEILSSEFRAPGIVPRGILGRDGPDRAGYVPALVGKWHLGHDAESLPTRRGFQSFFGMLRGSSGYTRHSHQGTPDLWRDEQPVEAEGRWSTELFADEAIAFIERQAAAAPAVDGSARAPWLLVLAPNAPHTADDRRSLPSPGRFASRFADPALTPERRAFLAALAFLDEQLGRVLDALERSGQVDETLVVFLSDNGPRPGWGSAGPLRGGKDTLDEGGLRVPCLLRWPGRLPAGSTCDAVLSSLDLLPTLLAVALGGKPHGLELEGRDVLDVLAGAAPSPGRVLAWTHKSRHLLPDGERHWRRVIRRGALRLSFTDGVGYELHDLSTDPGQARELSRERPELLAELVPLLERHAPLPADGR